MQPSSRPARTAAFLSDSINCRLNMYTLTATAAGVGMMALAQPVEAKIIYTPANVKVTQFPPVTIDLNHDGIGLLESLHVKRKAAILDRSCVEDKRRTTWPTTMRDTPRPWNSPRFRIVSSVVGAHYWGSGAGTSDFTSVLW
jgi:hypothetical protein